MQQWFSILTVSELPGGLLKHGYWTLIPEFLIQEAWGGGAEKVHF